MNITKQGTGTIVIQDLPKSSMFHQMSPRIRYSNKVLRYKTFWQVFIILNVVTKFHLYYKSVNHVNI